MDYTPKPQEEIDDSLYVYGKKGPQTPKTSVLDDKFNEYSTCQSNDSAESFGNPSKHSFESESEITSVPKEVSESKSVTTNEEVVSEPKPKETEPSCVTHVKTPRQQMKNQGTPKVWNNANRVNHANHFVPRPVQLNAVRPNLNSVRSNVNTGRAKVNSVRQNVNYVRSNVNTGRANVNSARSNVRKNVSSVR
ncbi:hypothetical protein Tco_0361098 [Tanacetum coccineum]